MATYFNTCFSEFDHVFIGNASISQNGDDAIELFKDSLVIETYGDANIDGTGEIWEYTDSWAFKDNGVWTYGGLDCTAGSTTTQGSNCLYPICPVTFVLVDSIFVEGQGGVSTISNALGTLQMEATVLPANADDNTFTWSVNNSLVATIDVNGVLTAASNGTVIVTASANDGSGVSGFVSIVISNQATSPTIVALSLKGIIDFNLTAGAAAGKGIHLTADSGIINLSSYALGVANNGGGTDGVEYEFPAISVAAGDQILVVRDSVEMATYFSTCFTEFDHVLIGNASISQNGDDAIELFKDSLVVETYGDVNIDGTGEVWEYTGSWAYKQMGVWTYGGLDCTAGSTTTQGSNCLYPICPVTFVLVDSIFVEGQGGVSTISNALGTLQMESTVLPANADDNNVTWSVNNPLIATIDLNGVLTAVSNGTVIVTATANDGSGVSGFASIVISNQATSPTLIALSLKGIIDFNLTAGAAAGKGIHLTADSTILDLSNYALGVANNGGGTDGVEYEFPVISVTAGDQILVVRDSAEMATYFSTCFIEFDHVLIGNSSISQNGDDAIELFKDSTVVETYGDVNIDGTGELWEYTGSWAYKEMGIWTYGGIACTDNSVTTQSSACPYPICPPPSGPILVASIVVDGQGGVSTISTAMGTLQMEAVVLPANADDNTYTWSVNNSFLATIDASGVLTALDNGIVEVTATANDASGITGVKSIVITNQTLGIRGNNSAQVLALYPNPSATSISFLTRDHIEVVKVFDVTGKLIENLSVKNNILNIETLDNGIYFLAAKIQDNWIRASFIKK
jgi:uncharacterized protein YjdB